MYRLRNSIPRLRRYAERPGEKGGEETLPTESPETRTIQHATTGRHVRRELGGRLRFRRTAEVGTSPPTIPPLTPALPPGARVYLCAYDYVDCDSKVTRVRGADIVFGL